MVKPLQIHFQAKVMTKMSFVPKFCLNLAKYQYTIHAQPYPSNVDTDFAGSREKGSKRGFIDIKLQ